MKTKRHFPLRAGFTGGIVAKHLHLLELLDEAVDLASTYSGGYSGDILSAEEFRGQLSDAVSRLRDGDLRAFEWLLMSFAPTSAWDGFVGIHVGVKYSNDIFSLMRELKPYYISDYDLDICFEVMVPKVPISPNLSFAHRADEWGGVEYDQKELKASFKFFDLELLPARRAWVKLLPPSFRHVDWQIV